MKNIKRFDESISDDQQLSSFREVSDDIKKFKEKFSDIPIHEHQLFDRWISRINEEIGELESYEVFIVNDYGRYSRHVTYVKARSRKHARILASIERDNVEIVVTGFYDSKKVDKSELETKIKSLEKELNLLKSAL